jgi:hypothetical protein
MRLRRHRLGAQLMLMLSQCKLRRLATEEKGVWEKLLECLPTI